MDSHHGPAFPHLIFVLSLPGTEARKVMTVTLDYSVIAMSYGGVNMRFGLAKGVFFKMSPGGERFPTLVYIFQKEEDLKSLHQRKEGESVETCQQQKLRTTKRACHKGARASRGHRWIARRRRQTNSPRSNGEHGRCHT